MPLTTAYVCCNEGGHYHTHVTSSDVTTTALVLLLILLLLHQFNGLFSSTSRVNRYQKGKTTLDLNEASDDGVLGRSDISWTIYKQSDPATDTSTPHHSISTRGTLFVMPNQQRQCTEGQCWLIKYN